MMRKGLAAIALLWFAGWALAALPAAANLYDEILPKVLQAKQVLAEDPAQALLLVEDAQKAFAEAKKSLPPVIAAGIERALEDARVSVARRSKADLEGRLWVVRGAFAKALYDAFFEAVAAGDLKTARALLDRLIEASARPESLKAKALALAQRKDLEGLRRLFERAYLEAIVKSLDLAGDGENRVHAYALVSKAYGLFLIIQDAPIVRDVRPQDFVDTLGALAKGDLEAYRQLRDALKAKLAKALSALEAKKRQTQSPPPPKREPVPAPMPSESASPAPQPKPAPAAPQPKPAPASPAVRAQPLPTKIKTLTVRAKAKPVVVVGQSEFERLVEDLTFLLGNHKKALQVAQELTSAGVRSLEAWLDQLYIAAGFVASAQVYLSTGRHEKARSFLGYAQARYLYSLYPLVAAVDPELAVETKQFFQKLTGGLGLRASDVAVLAVALERVRNRVFDERTPWWSNFQIAVEGATFGLPRAIFFLVAGALAFFPLLLIRLTFRGRNVYWRLLGYALFFLLAPAIMEAIAYLGEILAFYGGLPPLALLSNFSIFQSVVTQLLWGLTTFAVVVLAGWGLRGIARQFGLLKERAPLAEDEAPSPTATSESLIEWDEEF